MFERFTAQARHVVVTAQEEAAGFRHGYIGTEHILLALLDEGSGIASTVLRDAGVDRERVRADVERIVGRGRGSLGADDAAALREIGIDLDAVLSKIEERFGPQALRSPCPPPRRGLLRRRRRGYGGARPFTPRAKKVLELSMREALRMRCDHVGPEHILLGLLREGKGLAAQVLTAAGPTIDDLRRRTLAALDRAA
jgi:ATP-dependent Clp protease ATP-binding subunit ClpA